MSLSQGRVCRAWGEEMELWLSSLLLWRPAVSMPTLLYGSYRRFYGDGAVIKQSQPACIQLGFWVTTGRFRRSNLPSMFQSAVFLNKAMKSVIRKWNEKNTFDQTIERWFKMNLWWTHRLLAFCINHSSFKANECTEMHRCWHRRLMFSTINPRPKNKPSPQKHDNGCF